MEQWREIPEHPGYEVSDQGRVRSYRSRQGHSQDTPRLMSPKEVQGYMQIKLGRTRQAKVHTLMLETFVGPRPEGMVCRHLDGKPAHNVLENLCWGTLEENYADRHLHGTDNTGSRHGLARIHEDDVPRIRRMLAEGVAHEFIAEALTVPRGVIRKISSGKTWRHVPREGF